MKSDSKTPVKGQKRRRVHASASPARGASKGRGTGRNRRVLNVDHSALNLGDPDWSRACDVCGAKPTVYCGPKDPAPLCGPCTFGEGDTAGGNW